MCVPPNGFGRGSIFPLPKCRAKRPLLLPFPAERKREGPRGPSAFQFLLPLSRQSKKASVMQKFYEIVLTQVVMQVSLTRLHFRCFSNENEAKERSRGLRPSTPRTALRQRAVDRHVETRSAKRLQTHRLTAVQTGSLFVSPLREEIPSRATQKASAGAALAFHQHLR